MRRRLSLSVLMLVAGAALLVAAGLARSAGGAPAGQAAETRKGGTLRVSRLRDVDYVDPALAYNIVSSPIGFATCAKLFNYADEPGAAGTRVIPEVVRGFRVSRDGRTYTFVLKRTFRFHRGAPVTARSFAHAFNRDANPRMNSPAVTYMREIVGADAVIRGRAKTISGVRVLDRYRLQIRLRKPLGDFTARLTMPFFCPILPNTPINPAGINDPPGSGPYYVAERVVNRRIVLRRNRFYRGGRPANVDQVVWTVAESLNACLLATEQNRIDNCFVPAAASRPLAEKYGINLRGGRFFVSSILATSYFAFNHDRPAFKGRGQIPLKKAINYAIDRPELARASGYLGGRRTDQIVPPVLGRDGSNYPLRGADVAAARKWLARARLRPERLILYADNTQSRVAVAQVFAFNLKQIGIDVDVKYFDVDSLAQKLGTRGEPFDVAFGAWAVDYADPATFFVPLLSGDSIRQAGHHNSSYLDDPAVNGRIDTANRLTGAARRRAWADLDSDLMRNNPPWAPFIHNLWREFVSQSLGCYFVHPVYLLDIAAVCKN